MSKTCFCVMCNKQFPTWDPQVNGADGCATCLNNNTSLHCGYGSKHDFDVYSFPARLTANPHPNGSLICDNCVDTLINNKEIVFLHSVG